MRLSVLMPLLCASMFLGAQGTHTKLLGKCSINELKKEPYASWYNANYAAYAPNQDIVKKLKASDLGKLDVKIVFGSWCGDSKREVPRMMKVLHAASFNEKNIQLIAVDDSLDVYKQAPGREERGLGVYRVPTFIFYEKGKEVGRIVEFAVESIERDVFKIANRETYVPNYQVYSQINQWLATGLLQDPNISARGLAAQLKPVSNSESELNACGYVLMAQGALQESIVVLGINATLYPGSANCWDSLGEAYAKANQKERAIEMYEYVLQLDPQSTNAKEQLEKLRKQ